MRTIRISDEVWDEIAKRGKFGETPDDVLRRVFNISNNHNESYEPRGRYAKRRMTARIEDGYLFVGFQKGPSKDWPLPPKDDKNKISLIRSQAVEFAEQNGATLGQANAVRKALTDAGYWLTK